MCVSALLWWMWVKVAGRLVVALTVWVMQTRGQTGLAQVFSGNPADENTRNPPVPLPLLQTSVKPRWKRCHLFVSSSAPCSLVRTCKSGWHTTRAVADRLCSSVRPCTGCVWAPLRLGLVCGGKATSWDLPSCFLGKRGLCAHSCACLPVSVCLLLLEYNSNGIISATFKLQIVEILSCCKLTEIIL